jgi:hypothetical protein
MADYVVESIHDLLANDSESISDFVSSQGSYNLSHEYFMADIIDDPHSEATPEGHVTSANNGAPRGGTGLPCTLLIGVRLRRTQRSHPASIWIS